MVSARRVRHPSCAGYVLILCWVCSDTRTALRSRVARAGARPRIGRRYTTAHPRALTRTLATRARITLSSKTQLRCRQLLRTLVRSRSRCLRVAAHRVRMLDAPRARMRRRRFMGLPHPQHRHRQEGTTTSRCRATRVGSKHTQKHIVGDPIPSHKCSFAIAGGKFTTRRTTQGRAPPSTCNSSTIWERAITQRMRRRRTFLKTQTRGTSCRAMYNTLLRRSTDAASNAGC
jgi:hypothetical protein